MKNVKAIKGQSAMEYLMTYGWAILIIAIVLAALFSLGVFNGAALPTACIAQSGFSCTGPIYIHGGGTGAGNILMSVGQSSGNNWLQANIIFLNSTTLGTFQTGGSFPTQPPTNSIGPLNSGVAASIYLPVSPTSLSGTPIGTAVSGQIWARYVIGSTTYYSEIAIITAKAQ